MTMDIGMKIQNRPKAWSDQRISTRYKRTSADIFITGSECKIHLNGPEDEETFFLLWELLFLYDGYFYSLQNTIKDDVNENPDKLYRTAFYRTDRIWLSNGLLARSNRNLSTEVIEKYSYLRNQGKSQKKMTIAVMNSFYLIHSTAYASINCQHLLSLLLNVCEGFIINTEGDKHSVKGGLDKLFKNCIDPCIIEKGISLMGLPEANYRYNLAEERNELDHYIYKDNSIATFVYNSTESTANYITWYFIYLLDVIIRINILRKVGVEIDAEIRNHAAQTINDWIIYENRLDEICTTPAYRISQLLRGENNE